MLLGLLSEKFKYYSNFRYTNIKKQLSTLMFDLHFSKRQDKSLFKIFY